MKLEKLRFLWGSMREGIPIDEIPNTWSSITSLNSFNGDLNLGTQSFLERKLEREEDLREL